MSGKSIIRQKRVISPAPGTGSSISTPVSVANGGTGLASYAVGDLLYASASDTLSKLADVATGNALLSGGVGTAPNWGKITESHISLSDVTTLNSSTSAHGFFPKLTSNSIYYVNNAGALTALTVGASGTVLTGNGVTSAPTWATASSGITVGTTTITSGTTGSILMNIGGIVTESISYRAQQATPFSTAFGYTSHSSGSFSGVRNSSFGYEAGLSLTTGTDNTFIGQGAGRLPTTSSQNVAVGSGALQQGGGSTNVAIGYQALYTATGATTNTIGIGYRAGYLSGNAAGARCIYLGVSAGGNGGDGINDVLIIGYNASPTASNQIVIGAAGAASGNGVYNNLYFNGVTHTSPAPIVINAAGGSGTNIAGASLTLAGGKGTGSGAGGSFIVQTSTTLGSGTTLESLVSRLTISGGAVTTDASTATWADALDNVYGTTTGTKHGTATGQKQAWWGATPVVQQVLATGAAKTVDDVITLLQTLGLCKQA